MSDNAWFLTQLTHKEVEACREALQLIRGTPRAEGGVYGLIETKLACCLLAIEWLADK